MASAFHLSAQRSVTLVVALALSAGLGAGCRQASSTGGAPAVSPDTWAVVDGRPILRDEVDKAYRRSDHAGQAAPDEEVLAAKLELLNDLIVQDLLMAKAAALQITVPDSELDAAFAEARKNIPDDAFQQELGKRNLTAGDMREGLRRELLSQKVLEREVTSKVSVTEQEIADFFNANRAQFNLAEESYRLAQIVITPTRESQQINRSGDDAGSPQEAAAKVKRLMERLQGGASFRELAMDYSEDPDSAPRGGDLGLVPVSALKQAPPPLRDAVLKSQPGRVSVVRAADGGHTIVLVIAREAAGQRDLSMPAVRENITGRLRAGREQLLRTAYLTALRSDANVVNYLARRLVESQGRAAPVGLGPQPPK